MLSLTELVEKITVEFPQEVVLLNYFDFNTLKNALIPQPKFLFRGERTNTWADSKATFSRNLQNHDSFEEINYWLTGIHIFTMHRVNFYSLYYFIRESFWPNLEQQLVQSRVEEYIAVILQHYGFDTALLDVTSDLFVAASFASSGNLGDSGQIMVLETKNIEDQYFDLTQMNANRPKRQSAFGLWGTPQLDLKGLEFTALYKPTWHQFILAPDDKNRFSNPDLFSLTDDVVAECIVEWFETHIIKNSAVSNMVKTYFKQKIDLLTN